MKDIQVVDGLCGAGKTYALAKHIQQTIHFNSKYMVILPSKILADQVEQLLEDTFKIPNVFKVHSDTSSNVAKDLQDAIIHINTLNKGVIVATQQAYPNIPYFQNQDQWILVVDEIPSVDKFYEPTLPYNHSLITRFIEVETQLTQTLYKMKLVDSEYTRTFVQRNFDDVDNIVKPILQDMLHNRHCFVDKASWDKVITKQDITSDKDVDMTYGNEQNKIFFLTMLQPEVFEGFSQVIMMGANFTNSILHKYWSEYKNITFTPFNKIQKHLRYNEYNNGNRLTIKYLQEDKWSKYQRDERFGGAVFVGDVKCYTKNQFFTAKVNNTLQQDFLYAVNNDVNDQDLKGTRIPVISHGLNKYDHFNSIYFSPALNRKPKHSMMLHNLGFDDTFLDRANIHEVAHQCIMRTSMRRPDAKEDVTVIVVDKATAEELARMFIGAKIGLIDGGLRKVVGYRANDNTRKTKNEKFKELYQLNEDVLTFAEEDTIFTSCIKGKYDAEPQTATATTTEFVSQLQQIFNNNIITDKSEGWLFNGSFFKQTKHRRLEDVEFSSFITLDIDDGDLSPEEFHNIFSKDHKMAHIMMNSFSRSEEQPNRYRAIFFIKGYVTDEIYRDIHTHIQNIIRTYGYITIRNQKHKEEVIEQYKKYNKTPKFSGIDWSKQHTASFFFAPCQQRGQEQYAFFWKFGTADTRQLQRYSIDVQQTLTYMKDKTELTELVYEQTTTIEETHNIKDMIKDKLMSGQIYCGEHSQYGRLAAAMRHAGYTLQDLIDVTPYVANSKTNKDANHFWNSWNKYEKITMGTLFTLAGIK